jgi:WD40 repeat protein
VCAHREEFASHLIALGQSRRPEPTMTQKVLGENLNAGMDKSTDHSMMIEVAAYIPSNQWRPDIEKYITCTSDGVVHLWSSAGQPLKTSVTLTGASSYVLCTAPFSKFNVVAIGSNDHKIRFFSFEPRLRLGTCHLGIWISSRAHDASVCARRPRVRLWQLPSDGRALLHRPGENK